MCNSCISLVLSVMGDLLSHQFGNLPLATAADHGHTETVQRLLEAGANVNHQNKASVLVVCTYSIQIHTNLSSLSFLSFHSLLVMMTAQVYVVKVHAGLIMLIIAIMNKKGLLVGLYCLFCYS